jgi:GNAT superfamily N-acetyltransferase
MAKIWQVNKSPLPIPSGNHPIHWKTKKPAPMSLEMFSPFDISKARINEKKVVSALEKAEEKSMNRKRFLEFLNETDLNEDERKFAGIYYLLYITSFRKENLVPASDFLGYHLAEPLSEIAETGCASFLYSFFDADGMPAAMISGALVLDKSKGENLMFVGYRAVAKEFRRRQLSEQLIEFAIRRIKKETNYRIGFIVGEADRPEDFKNIKDRREAKERLKWLEQEGRITIKGLRWAQPIHGYGEKTVSPPETQCDLALMIKKLGSGAVSKADVEKIVRLLGTFYELGDRKIAGSGENALEVYFRFSMRDVGNPPEILRPTSLCESIPKK